MFALKLICVIFFVFESSGKVLKTPPLSSDEAAKVARRLMHDADWVSAATISTRTGIEGYPFASLKSVSDGSSGNSSGIPYFYLTDRDVTAKDILANNKCSVMVSKAQTDFCQKQKYDSQDPRCAKLMLTGKMIKVAEDGAEHTFAQNGLFEKHPSMKHWPRDHGFYITKFEIEQIALLSAFGGINNISTIDYFNAVINATDITTQSI